MSRYWVGVVSNEHVRKATEGGFFQANHGREGPVKRMAQGDGVLFYSPREGRRSGDTVQAFTAIGEVVDVSPHQAAQSGTFKPFRRTVRYFKSKPADIHPLLDRLSFATAGASWGQTMRRRFFEIPSKDYQLIACAMGVPAR